MSSIKAFWSHMHAGSGGDRVKKLASSLWVRTRGAKGRRCQFGRLDGQLLPPPWYAYHALMGCRLVALDKRPGVRPLGIRGTLRRALAKLVMRAAGDQAKTECVNMQLCAGLEDGI